MTQVYADVVLIPVFVIVGEHGVQLVPAVGTAVREYLHYRRLGWSKVTVVQLVT